MLQFLREVMHLSGTKLGCAEGGCGACTVMISKVSNDKTVKYVLVLDSDDLLTTDGNVAQGCRSISFALFLTDSFLSTFLFNCFRHYSANACLMPVLAADGCHITTVEGVGSVEKNNVHPVQKAMVELHGSQCGFCTPGIIVSIYTHLLANTETDKTASVEHLEEHLDGNLCRCTGYRPIWDAARALCDDANDDSAIRGPCGTPCRECPERESCTQDCNETDKAAESVENGLNIDDLCISSSRDKAVDYKEVLAKMDGEWRNQPDNMFPDELLKISDDIARRPLVVVDTTEFHAGGTWFKATTLTEMLHLLDEFAGHCKIVVGNTEVGIETRFKQAVYPRLLCPSESIEELYIYAINKSDNSIMIGSCCPLSTVQHQSGVIMSSPEKYSTGLRRTAQPMHDMLRWFASSQIRNVACLGGNLVTASPISDMNPLLACFGATLTLSSVVKHTTQIERRVVPVSSFFVKYRTVDLRPSEMVEFIEVPVVANVFEYVKPFKQARRREDDISIVTSGMRIRLKIQGDKYFIDDIVVAFGGMAPTTILATKTMAALIGAELCAGCFECATEVLLDELKLPEQVPGGQAAYRMTLAASFLYKFYLSSVLELKDDIAVIEAARGASPESYPDLPATLPPPPSVDETEISGTNNFLIEKKPKYYGVQKFPKPKVAKGLEDVEIPVKITEEKKCEDDVVGKPAPHMSGPLHCTGEAIYNDDIPLPPGTLQAVLVLSKECGRILKNIDKKPGLAIPGVVGIFTADDVEALGGDNTFGVIKHDEYVFHPFGETVGMVGQTLGIVIAETLESAELAARMVMVEYGEASQEGSKIVVTIEDAIEANSFYEFSRHVLERGDASILSSLKSMTDTAEKPQIGDVVKISGTCYSGPQEHFYLETHSALVVPSEANTQLTVYSSTQGSAEVQAYVGPATNTPAHKVVCRVKRLGGGFGGKESRPVGLACAVAVAAKIVNRPVRLTFARDVDMKTTGTRHAFVTKYNASAKMTEDGNAKLIALDVMSYNNGGSSFDLSGPVMDRALLHIDNCYFFPNLRAEGICCKTAQAPHTAFRGFGGPQGMAVAEHVMDQLSFVTGISGDTLRRSNLFRDGDTFAFGTVVGETSSGKWHIPSMWDRLYKELDIPSRRRVIEEFNAKNKWVKRGLSILPCRFGIAYTNKVCSMYPAKSFRRLICSRIHFL